MTSLNANEDRNRRVKRAACERGARDETRLKRSWHIFAKADKILRKVSVVALVDRAGGRAGQSAIPHRAQLEPLLRLGEPKRC